MGDILETQEHLPSQQGQAGLGYGNAQEFGNADLGHLEFGIAAV